jgi:rhodanese-related sulfurtransferase
MKRAVLPFLALVLVASSAVFAADAKEVGEISLADLKKAIAEKKVTLVDANGSESFKAGHLPGAIDFAAAGDKLAEALPKDKGALVVAYCGSEKCNAYKKAAEAAQKLGYTNVSHFKGGLAGWKEAGEKLEAASVEAKPAVEAPAAK